MSKCKAAYANSTAIGHKVDKVEANRDGRNLPATPMEYQTWFIQRCLDAVSGKASANLEEAKANAEVSETRNVGITVETRPDWAKQPHINAMLGMGVPALNWVCRTR